MVLSSGLISALVYTNLPTTNYSYHNPLRRGVRIAIRPKVNDNLITGPKVVDRIIPVGLGQRQLVLGDRYTGKTTVSIPMLPYSSSISRLVGTDGFGTRRIIGSYIGTSQNLSKPPKSIKTLLFISWLCIISFSWFYSLLFSGSMCSTKYIKNKLC